MLIVSAKSAVAFVVGGALLGQQADNSNREVAPPAPPAPAAETARDVQPENVSEAPVENARQSEQAQSASDRARPEVREARPDSQRQDRQTFQDAEPADEQGRSALGVTLTDDLRVIQVAPGSPAERMGLRSRDEILSMNGQTFNSIDEFIETVGATPQDQEIQLEIDRDGRNMMQSGRLAAWDRVHYSETRIAAMGQQHQGPQHHSAMRFTDDGQFMNDQAYGGQMIGDACCYDPCAGFGYGHAGYGYGYGGWNDGWSRREARRAARRGYLW